jgi:hypothetical protein
LGYRRRLARRRRRRASTCTARCAPHETDSDETDAGEHWRKRRGMEQEGITGLGTMSGGDRQVDDDGPAVRGGPRHHARAPCTLPQAAAG